MIWWSNFLHNSFMSSERHPSINSRKNIKRSTERDIYVHSKWFRVAVHNAHRIVVCHQDHLRLEFRKGKISIHFWDENCRRCYLTLSTAVATLVILVLVLVGCTSLTLTPVRHVLSSLTPDAEFSKIFSPADDELSFCLTHVRPVHFQNHCNKIVY